MQEPGVIGWPDTEHDAWVKKPRAGIINYDNSLLDVDGLVQERRNSSALAMELRLSCTNPSM